MLNNHIFTPSFHVDAPDVESISSSLSLPLSPLSLSGYRIVDPANWKGDAGNFNFFSENTATPSATFDGKSGGLFSPVPHVLPYDLPNLENDFNFTDCFTTQQQQQQQQQQNGDGGSTNYNNNVAFSMGTVTTSVAVAAAAASQVDKKPKAKKSINYKKSKAHSHDDDGDDIQSSSPSKKAKQASVSSVPISSFLPLQNPQNLQNSQTPLQNPTIATSKRCQFGTVCDLSIPCSLTIKDHRICDNHKDCINYKFAEGTVFFFVDGAVSRVSKLRHAYRYGVRGHTTLNGQAEPVICYVGSVVKNLKKGDTERVEQKGFCLVKQHGRLNVDDEMLFPLDCFSRINEETKILLVNGKFTGNEKHISLAQAKDVIAAPLLSFEDFAIPELFRDNEFRVDE